MILSHTCGLRKAISLLAAAAICLLFLRSHQRHNQRLPDPDLALTQTCRNLPGADRVMMVLKTGATEIQDKFGVHTSKTLQCYPHKLIFSDHADVIGSHRIIDALENVTPTIRETHSDFQLWRRLAAKGREALQMNELSGTDSKERDESLRIQNPGWKLDKWKFLPMMNETLHRSDAGIQWFVFVEADTYVIWSSLLHYLRALNWRKPHYLGSELDIENTWFAHGGSGFALSRPAMEKVVTLFGKTQDRWEEFTDRYWAGDHILGAALLEVDVPLTPSWPSWQGQDVGHIWWEVMRSPRLWCEIAVSYHHESPAGIAALWDFEQEWIKKTSSPVRHKDVFEKFVIPRIKKEPQKLGWDNNSGYPRGPVKSLQECEAICKKEEDCLQYSLRDGSECTTTSQPFLGDVSNNVDSGWMPERFQKFYDTRESC